VETHVQPQVNRCGVYGIQNGTMTGFYLGTLDFLCQYHSTIAPHSFIHLPHTLYNVPLTVLQFSPVSIIPPILHTHSFFITVLIWTYILRMSLSKALLCVLYVLLNTFFFSFIAYIYFCLGCLVMFLIHLFRRVWQHQFFPVPVQHTVNDFNLSILFVMI
jgi:hypothetical protein